MKENDGRKNNSSKPGPRGRQKGRIITDHLESILERDSGIRARVICEQVVQMAEQGCEWAIKWVTDRTEGKVPDTLNVNQTIDHGPLVADADQILAKYRAKQAEQPT